jgi:hypothetical protein
MVMRTSAQVRNDALQRAAELSGDLIAATIAMARKERAAKEGTND